MYIVFEGLIGSGKTTQSKRLAEDLQERFPEKTVLWTREPGGGEIAEAVRTLVQATPFQEPMEPLTEVYLYASARAQSLRSAVFPVLQKGGVVIADRSFATSIAWQGFGHRLGLEKILEVNHAAVQSVMPDLFIELRLDPQNSLKRASDAKGDKFETMPLDFHDRCAKGYEEIAQHPFFKDRWRVIDAAGSPDEVYQKILAALPTGLLENKENP